MPLRIVFSDRKKRLSELRSFSLLTVKYSHRMEKLHHFAIKLLLYIQFYFL